MTLHARCKLSALSELGTLEHLTELPYARAHDHTVLLRLPHSFSFHAQQTVSGFPTWKTWRYQELQVELPTTPTKNMKLLSCCEKEKTFVFMRTLDTQMRSAVIAIHSPRTQ